MEIDNPIKLLNWFLGKWEGSIVENEVEYNSKIIWQIYGHETHVLEIYKKVENTENLLETQYFFFDKTKEQVKCIIFNTDGYIESNNVEIHGQGTDMMLSVVFDSGYNLPPNMKIVREISKIDKDSFVLIVKMGEKQQLYSESSYNRTR